MASGSSSTASGKDLAYHFPLKRLNNLQMPRLGFPLERLPKRNSLINSGTRRTD
jgi:hypothetical protein